MFLSSAPWPTLLLLVLRIAVPSSKFIILFFLLFLFFCSSTIIFTPSLSFLPLASHFFLVFPFYSRFYAFSNICTAFFSYSFSFHPPHELPFSIPSPPYSSFAFLLHFPHYLLSYSSPYLFSFFLFPMFLHAFSYNLYLSWSFASPTFSVLIFSLLLHSSSFISFSSSISVFFSTTAFVVALPVQDHHFEPWVQQRVFQ